jgi:hypothetical protein
VEGGLRLVRFKSCGHGVRGDRYVVLRCGPQQRHATIADYLWGPEGQQQEEEEEEEEGAQRLKNIGGLKALRFIEKTYPANGIIVQSVEIVYRFSGWFKLDDLRGLAAAALKQYGFAELLPCAVACPHRLSRTTRCPKCPNYWVAKKE